MKIIQVVNSSEIGGAEKIALEIEKKLKIPRFILFKRKKENKFSPSRLSALIKIVQKQEITALHAHHALALAYCLIARTRYPHLKIIYHEHGEVLYNKKLRLFLHIFGSKIDAILAVSKSVQRALNEIMPGMQIIILRNYVPNIPPSKLETRRQNVLLHNESTVGYVGRLHKLKGCADLICALALLHKTPKCIIVGDGDERDNLHKLADRLGLTHQINFVGKQSNPFTFYNSMDVLVVPSHTESLGLVAMEAQSAGIPVIATHVGGLPEIVKHHKTGLLVPPHDPSSIAKAIDLLRSDKKLRFSLSKNAAKNKFPTEKQYMQELKKVYMELY